MVDGRLTTRRRFAPAPVSRSVMVGHFRNCQFLPLDDAVAYYMQLPFKPDALRGIMGDNTARLFKLG